MIGIKIDLVNKQQYEESEIYKEIKIIIPREEEQLQKDFEYLDLNYSNLSIQDTHIKECEFIWGHDDYFAEGMTKTINNLIKKAIEEGYTTTFQDMTKLFDSVKHFDNFSQDKFLAIMEAKKDSISNLRDAIKYAKHLPSFNLIPDIYSKEAYAEKLVEEGEVDISDVIDYIDYSSLGEDYIRDNDGTITNYGILIQDDESFEYGSQKQEEDEEEFE